MEVNLKPKDLVEEIKTCTPGNTNLRVRYIAGGPAQSQKKKKVGKIHLIHSFYNLCISSWESIIHLRLSQDQDNLLFQTRPGRCWPRLHADLLSGRKPATCRALTGASTKSSEAQREGSGNGNQTHQIGHLRI